LPSLQSLKEQYRDKPFKVLLINVQETRNDVAGLFKLAQVDLQVVLDQNGDVSRDYHVTNHPIKFLIDPQGNLMAMGIGYRDWDSEGITGLVDVLIGETEQSPGT